MSASVRQHMFERPIFKDTFYIILFGILSWGLSLVGVAEMNMREIPLLICLIHVRRPGYVLVLSLFTLLNPPTGIPLWAVYGVHLVPLMIACVAFKLLENRKLPNIVLGMYSVMITLGYYLLALLPLVVITIATFMTTDSKFSTMYVELLQRSSFEIISSALVVSFYLMQLEIRKALVVSNENLSDEVQKRTIELTSANNELVALNEELKSSNDNIIELNESLERMVRERTEKINQQLSQLSKYAYMNAHDVRAPLARMLGLMQLIKHSDVPVEQKAELIDMLYDASNELDNIVKEMNRLLEKEIE